MDNINNEKELIDKYDEIINYIKEYKVKCKDLYESLDKNKTVVASIKRLFAIKDDFATNEIHDEYFPHLEALKNDLISLIKKVDNESLVSRIADDILVAVCVPATKYEKKYIGINYDADDNIFNDLVKFMSKKEVINLYSDFNSRRALLPNQKMLLHTLKAEIKSRGL